MSPFQPMQQNNFEDVLNTILEKDARYHRDAYLFLRESLDHTQKSIGRRRREVGHITGQELLEGIREYALENFGPMAISVLEEWGVRTCEDFGNMVFLMVDHNLLRKTDQDTPEDFRKGYNFEDAFRAPFLPASKPKHSGPEGPGNLELEKI